VSDEKLARVSCAKPAAPACAIDHPNICSVYEVNEVEQVLFFALLSLLFH
jgi:hypothetical protein